MALHSPLKDIQTDVLLLYMLRLDRIIFEHLQLDMLCMFERNFLLVLYIE